MPYEEGLLAATRRIEVDERLDPIVSALQGAARPLGEGPIRPVLAGRWLGHAFHPLLTDYPLGCWTSAMLLDLVGGRESRVASRRLIGIGVLAAVPTAAAGLSDWLHADRRSQRVGVVHAASNTTALAFYTASYVVRRRDHHFRGFLLGVVGGLAAILGGFFGGHLTLTASVTRDNRLIDDSEDVATADDRDDDRR